MHEKTVLPSDCSMCERDKKADNKCSVVEKWAGEQNRNAKTLKVEGFIFGGQFYRLGYGFFKIVFCICPVS